MLTIRGGQKRFCDGVSRRDFLAIGGLSFGMGGLSAGNTPFQQQAYRECGQIAPAR